MKRTALASGLLLSLLYSHPAHALGKKVLWYENSSFSVQNMTAAQQAAILAAGASSYAETTVWPAVITDYRVIFLSLPTANLSAAQITDLNTFIAGGGIVVMVAEGTAYAPSAYSVHNTTLSSLGISTRFVGGAYDPGCFYSGARQVVTNVLTAGVATLEYAYGSSISVAGSGKLLYKGTSMNPAAREGHVLLIGDGNIFYGGCSFGANNTTFTANIYKWSCDYDEDLVVNQDCGGNDQDDNNAAVGANTSWYKDVDGDGYGDPSTYKYATTQPAGYVADGTDCDDTTASRNPGKAEICDGIDNDCDSTVDDGFTIYTWYKDADGDGYGNSSLSTTSCAMPTGYVSNATDCDDTTSSRNPGKAEVCDGIDNDCDTVVDDGLSLQTWYIDQDGDTYGSSSTSVTDCYTTAPSGYVASKTDCDDLDATIHPGASEYCDGVDENCDGAVDNSALDAVTWYRDVDGDGYGNSSLTKVDCSAPAGYVGDKTDCDDSSVSVHPNASEYCNKVDDDCDGTVDENSAVDAQDWYRDLDGDSYGNPSLSVHACNAPSSYVADSTDCNDSSSSIHPGASEYCNAVDDNCNGAVDDAPVDGTSWYMDADGDTYGDVSRSVSTCTVPTGYVGDSTDCVDTNAAIHPNATELCNGIDDDCDGVIDPSSASNAATWYQDQDGDTFGNPSVSTPSCSQPAGYVADRRDCDDSNASISPIAQELCNGYDDDCDGTVDIGAVGAGIWYADQDADTYGDLSRTQSSCNQPTGYVADSKDCNDGNAAIHPLADEHCDGVDEDCDGSVDDSPVDGLPWYADADGDAYGDVNRTVSLCTAPVGYVADATDCVDTNSVINPGATEVCNGLDDNCDGVIDPSSASGAGSWYQDQDGDNYGNVAVSTNSCQQPAGYVASPDDCNDTDAAIYPTATEVCDAIDNDCDGQVDEADAVGAGTWYADADADGFGDALITTPGCNQPSGYVTDSSDCDDSSNTTYPGAAEIPYDGVDQDCDGLDLIDADGDGYAAIDAGGLDCLDTDPLVYPGSTESPDGVDENCDGTVDEGTVAYDDDGDGYTEEAGDCNDGDLTIHPGAVEQPNGVDENCNAIVDENTDLYDDDGDGQSEVQGDCNDGDPAASGLNTEVLGNGIDDDCDGVVDSGEVDLDGDGYTQTGGDCAESDSTIHPGAPELPDGLDNDCDGMQDEGTNVSDDDGDGYSEDQGDSNDGDPSVNPGAPELPDGIDNNGDGRVDEGTDAYDDDADGFTEDGGDCDDASPATYPGAEEIEDGKDNDCDGAIDEHSVDLDDDGFTVDEGDCDDDQGWAHPNMIEFCDGIDNNCNGDVDEECNGDITEDVTTPKPEDPCGCASGAEGAGSSLIFGLALVAARRRRR